jgi:heat shock protein HslJ
LIRRRLGIVALGMIVVACIRPGVPDGSGATLVLEGTHGRAVSILGLPPLPQAVPTLVFENHAEAGGFAGCNGYGTVDYRAEGGAISFGQLTQTGMGCLGDAVMAQEARFMQALSEAQRVELRDGLLVISGPGGEVVLERLQAGA